MKFNVCLVNKPLGVFSSEIAERFASVSEDELCEKCIIKQLLWFLHDIMSYQNLVSDLGFDNS